jgi:hypothetical protein
MRPLVAQQRHAQMNRYCVQLARTTASLAIATTACTRAPKRHRMARAAKCKAPPMTTSAIHSNNYPRKLVDCTGIGEVMRSDRAGSVLRRAEKASRSPVKFGLNIVRTWVKWTSVIFTRA